MYTNDYFGCNSGSSTTTDLYKRSDEVCKLSTNHSQHSTNLNCKMRGKKLLFFFSVEVAAFRSCSEKIRRIDGTQHIMPKRSYPFELGRSLKAESSGRRWLSLDSSKTPRKILSCPPRIPIVPTHHHHYNSFHQEKVSL